MIRSQKRLHWINSRLVQNNRISIVFFFKFERVVLDSGFSKASEI